MKLNFRFELANGSIKLFYLFLQLDSCIYSDIFNLSVYWLVRSDFYLSWAYLLHFSKCVQGFYEHWFSLNSAIQHKRLESTIRRSKHPISTTWLVSTSSILIIIPSFHNLWCTKVEKFIFKSIPVILMYVCKL